MFVLIFEVIVLIIIFFSNHCIFRLIFIVTALIEK